MELREEERGGKREVEKEKRGGKKEERVKGIRGEKGDKRERTENVGERNRGMRVRKR